jgi:hypothetical protein
MWIALLVAGITIIGDSKVIVIDMAGGTDNIDMFSYQIKCG